MNEKPILFSGPMVRAILEGRKTVTRRVLPKHQIPELGTDGRWFSIAQRHPRWGFGVSGENEAEWAIEMSQSGCCPYGKPGDRLWVRESWQVSEKYDRMPPSEIPWLRGVSTYFAAGGSRAHDASGAYVNEDTICVPDWVGRMRPSIHMPRLASRILLEVVSVNVERLQDITDEQGEAEGVDFLRAAPDCDETLTAAQLFDCLWSSINGAESWAANPWVWAVEFKVVA